jgi:hypothetical protein
MIRINVFCATGKGGGIDATCGSGSHDKWMDSLSAPEQHALVKWADGSQGPMRASYAKGTPSAEALAVVTAASRLPAYMGMAYRGMPSAPAILALKPGTVIQDRAPASFSESTKTAHDFAEGGVMFSVKHKTARAIGSVDGFRDEKEVLSMPGAKFRITKVEQDVEFAGKRLQHVIHMEEV